MEKLKVPVNRQLQERSEKIANIAKKRSLAVNMKPAKRRRLQLKQKRKKREDVEYLKEGDTYESGIQLRKEEDVDSEKIPSFTAYPPEENIKMTENITFISVDVETTSNDNSGEIIELSATLNDNEFDQYVLPNSDISDRSSQITSLRKIGNVLLCKGSPVDTVGMRECALKFLDWLNKIDGKKILYGQNSKGCDSRMICKAFRDVNLEKEFGQSVLGYSDRLPLFRRLYPNQESHTQEQLCQNLIGYSYTAHNSLEHWKNIYKSYHENIMFFREKIINCFLKIIIIMIFFFLFFGW